MELLDIKHQYLSLIMCYHYTITTPKNQLENRFSAHFDALSDYRPIYHADGFSHRAMPVITADKPAEIQLYHWGLIPHWVKDRESAKQLSNQTLNAVSETVYEKPSFKAYRPKKRCLVLADGFFEWMHAGKNKYPHYIYLNDHQPFAFAGIYSHWADKETGEIIKTYSILTTAANDLMAKIHNVKKRMPVILKPEDEQKWLEQDLPQGEIVNLLQPLDSKLLAAHTISKLITSRSENPDQEKVLEPFTYPELAML